MKRKAEDDLVEFRGGHWHLPQPPHGMLRDRDGNLDVILVIAAWVGFAAFVAVMFALWKSHTSIEHLNAAEVKDAIAHGNAVAAILTATGSFINNVLLGLGGFGLAVAGYWWTDAQNKRAQASVTATTTTVRSEQPAAAPT